MPEKKSKFEIIFFQSLGVLFSLLGILMYILPMFVTIKKDYTSQGWYIPILITVFGVALYYYYKEIAKRGVDAVSSIEEKATNVIKKEIDNNINNINNKV